MGSITMEQVQMASMLINLGLTTVTKIKELFSADENDDAVLAAIMAEVDKRIARRS